MRMTGGGIVFGGGEPLGQEYFVKECALYSQKTLPDIPLRIETSLQASIKNVQELLPYISLWIIDIKDLNPDVYYRYTHGQMDLMWNNLMYLVQHAPYGQDSIWVRVPRIPGYNTNRDIQKSVRRLQPYVKHIEVFSYRKPPEKREGTTE
ncbi:pyruvate formate-lyase activating enzyme [Megasphaera sp. BL7]|jgi:pyruvate formate lyase activating enzyme|nr:pyruvate formate-lyase activating enzyme [Megasphaera sp. BL7]EPP17878.1 pyruvate formate-lyase activating enzyme [Megasphaera sp. NM10]